MALVSSGVVVLSSSSVSWSSPVRVVGLDWCPSSSSILVWVDGSLGARVCRVAGLERSAVSSMVSLLRLSRDSGVLLRLATRSDWSPDDWFCGAMLSGDAFDAPPIPAPKPAPSPVEAPLPAADAEAVAYRESLRELERRELEDLSLDLQCELADVGVHVDWLETKLRQVELMLYPSCKESDSVEEWFANHPVNK